MILSLLLSYPYDSEEPVMPEIPPSPAVQKYIEAAQTLADRGENVTLAAVRREAGGGSMNTITEGVRIWREAQAEDQAPAAVMIPEAVQEASTRALASIWKAAQAEHRAALEAEREALAADRQKLEAGKAEALELGRVVEAEAEQTKRELEQVTKQAEELAARVAQEREAAARATAQAEERAEQLRAVNADLARTRKDARAIADDQAAKLAALDAELTNARNAVKEAEHQAGEAAARADRSELRADQAEAAAKQATDHATDLEQEITQLQGEAKTIGSELAQSIADAKAGKREIEKALAQLQEADGRERQARDEAAELRGRLSALEASALAPAKKKPARRRKPAAESKPDAVQ